MIRATLREEWLEEAQQRASALPIFNNSHRGFKANQAGCLGEIVFEAYMKARKQNVVAELEETTHDYRLENGLTVDVKTKDRTVVPQADYDCSVPLYNHSHQKPDYFFFVSLLRERGNNSEDIGRYKGAYICGVVSYPTMNEKGVVWEKGQTDPRNGTKFWTSCLNIEVDQLSHPIVMLGLTNNNSPCIV